MADNFFVVNRTGFGAFAFAHIFELNGTMFYCNVDAMGRVIDVTSD